MEKLTERNNFESEKRRCVLHIIDQIKGSRVPQKMGHDNLCMEAGAGHLKLRLQSL